MFGRSRPRLDAGDRFLAGRPLARPGRAEAAASQGSGTMGLVLDRLELRQLAILALGAGLLGVPPLAFARPDGAAPFALLLPLLALLLVAAQHLLLRRSVLRPVLEAARADHDRLAASEARFATAAEAIPDGLAIFDAEERLVYHNRHYPELLAEPYRATLELGQPIDRWVERARAVGPIYHPEMGEDFLERRLALKKLAAADHEHRLADGRWMRVRERRMENGGRILLVSDISEARAQAAALEASRERFRSIVDDQVEFISRLDRELRFTFVNEAYARQLGREREDLLGASVLDLMTEGQRARFLTQLATLAPQRPTVAYEMEGRRADGSPSIEAWVDRALFDRDGRVIEYQSVGRDVTEERRAAEALRASEARLAAFMAHAPVGVHIKDVEGRYVMANPEMAKIFRRPVEQVLGLVPSDLFPPEEAAMIDRHHRAVVESGRPIRVEEHQPSLDAYEWAAMFRFPIRDADGRITGVGGFAVDITPQKRAQAELAASEARFRTIAELQPVPLTITRLADRKVMFANRAYYATFGLDPAEIAGDFDRDRLYEDPAEREAIFAALAAGRSVEGRSLRMRAKNGRAFPVVFEARPIVYDGEPCGVAAMQDVSELEAAEAEIRRQREALHQTEKLSALGTLLAGVAHELNNPLSVVVGYASLLREQTEDAAVRARAERIHTAAERCARIVKTFLAMARQKPPAWGVVRAEAVIEAALELAGYQLRSAGVEVERDFAPGLPAIWGDADQLHQVLTNLVVNAHQALLQVAPPRRLRLGARRLGPDRVAIAVEDNGPGMSEEVRQRIFEPFFTTKPQGVGTGVGLAVCHGIVGAHRGRIEVESAPGVGTRVRVILPVAEEEGPTASAAALEAPERRPARARILVVDDEAELAELVAERLRGRGFAVETAASGRAALDRLAREEADAIVTDLRMPEVDGPALLEEVRRRYPRLAGRIVIVTGDALSAEVGDLAREAGLPLLEKPLDLEVLEARLRDLLATPAASAARGVPAG